MPIHPKATGGAAGGSMGAWIAIILLWLLSAYGHVDPPPTVVEAITGMITVAVGFAGAYMASSPWISPSRNVAAPEPVQPATVEPAAQPAPSVTPAPQAID